MYAIFEEVVGPQPSVTFSNNKDSQSQEDDDQGIVVTQNGDPKTSTDAENSDSASRYGTSRTRTKRSPVKHQRIYGSSSYQNRRSSTLPRSGRRCAHSSTATASNDLDEISSTSSSNPLLDTISVLAYDPPDDSDDYYDLTGVAYEQCRETSKGEEEKPVKHSPGGNEGDRDSIGYAGSSSIDSGYKSFCPTPEIPDSLIYGTDNANRTHPYSGFYSDSNSASPGRCGKPRIMMGTKVISRQGQLSPSPLRESPGSRRSDSSLYDVNLDHLMYLRQSLLSAIQKCESSKSEEQSSFRQSRKDAHHADKIVNPVEDQRYSDSSSSKAPQQSYQKTVRFNTDVKISTVNSSQPPCESSDVNPCRTGDSNGDQTGNCKVQSKSILKDPLCANLRSQLEAGSQDCTLEEEIDSLLYGRAEFYDLESVDDFPCSYVTMIEEKYRSGKPSLAKVRKLKGGKTQEPTSKGSESETSSTTNTNSEEDNKQQKSPSKESSSTSSTVSISKTAKCRFTEVARCMLEIIEDLQMKKMQPDSAKDSSGAGSEPANTAPPPATPKSGDPVPENGTSADSKSEYTAAAEYHVYEEITYDFVGSGVVPPPPKRVELPPPLPARPSTMFTKPVQQSSQRCRAPSPPPRKGRCPQKRCPQTSEGTVSEVRNRPKQRGNLYCLFADRAERRNISRSLEREWRVAGPSDNQEDDYGFRKEFPSI